jgi:hypothetical protein
MAISAMTSFMRRPCSSTRSSCRALSASAPAARKASRHSLRVAAVTPCLRLVNSRSAPRSSSRTTLALRLADQRPLPPRPVSGPAPVALPVAEGGPGNRRIGVGHLSLLVSQISVQRNRAAGEAGLSGAETGAPDWGILKAARGEGFIIMRRCALRPMGSWWPKGAFFPPRHERGGSSWQERSRRRTTGRGAARGQGRRHDAGSIASIRERITGWLIRQLPCCPFCGARRL